MRIDVSQLYFVAESLGEQFDDVHIITLKEEARRLATEDGLTLDDIDRFPAVCEYVEITNDNVTVCIDVPYINDVAEFEVVQRVATALSALQEGRGRVNFSYPRRFSAMEMTQKLH